MTRIVWMALGLVYAAFFSWYTNCSGPLTAEEVDQIVAQIEERQADADIGEFRRFLESDTGDDFVMVNIMDLPPKPKPVAGVGPDETTEEVMGRYMAHMWPELLKRACHPVMMGTAAAVALDVWGIEGAERWTGAGMMRYRSRRDLIEIAGNPAFQGPHEFKLAAMTKTIAFPIDPWFHFGDPRLLLALIFFGVGASVELLARRRAGS